MMAEYENKYKCINKYSKTILEQTKNGIKQPIIKNLTKEEADTLNDLVKDTFWLECTNYLDKEDTIDREIENFFSKDTPKRNNIKKKYTQNNKTNKKRYECIKKYANAILEQTSNCVIPPKIKNITKEEQDTLNQLIIDVFWYNCCLKTPYKKANWDEIGEIEDSIFDLFDYNPYDDSEDSDSDYEYTEK